MCQITKISAQKNDRSRVNLYVDGEFFCGLSLNTLAKHGLYEGKEIEEEELGNILKDDLHQRVTQRVLQYISSTVKTEMQIRKYIVQLLHKKKGEWYVELDKHERDELVEKVISNLKEYGYLDDGKFAEALINSRLKNKPRGKSVLLAELISKGVEKSLAEQKIDECVLDEYELLKNVFNKKFKDGKITKSDTKKIAYLQRKGFSWDLIEQLINDDTRE